MLEKALRIEVSLPSLLAQAAKRLRCSGAETRQTCPSCGRVAGRADDLTDSPGPGGLRKTEMAIMEWTPPISNGITVPKWRCKPTT